MRSAFALLFFVSLPVLACPQLAGSYKACRTSSSEGSDVEEIMIEQKIVNKVMEYTFSTSEAESGEVQTEKYVADGKIQTSNETDEDTGISIKTATTTTCSGDILKIKMNAKMDAQEIANVVVQISKVSNQLIQNYSGTSMGEPVSETVICEQ